MLHHRFILFSTVKCYNQIDGVAMASSLVPALANIFMGFHEPKWLNEYNINKPKLYWRNVDDILAAFDKEQNSLNFSIFFKIGILTLNLR